MSARANVSATLLAAQSPVHSVKMIQFILFLRWALSCNFGEDILPFVAPSDANTRNNVLCFASEVFTMYPEILSEPAISPVAPNFHNAPECRGACTYCGGFQFMHGTVVLDCGHSYHKRCAAHAHPICPTCCEPFTEEDKDALLGPDTFHFSVEVANMNRARPRQKVDSPLAFVGQMILYGGIEQVLRGMPLLPLESNDAELCAFFTKWVTTAKQRLL